MARYLRLYLYFLRFSFSKAFEFRVDFWFRVVMDAFYYAVNIGFYRVLYVHTDLLAGWDERQVMVFVGSYLVVDGLNMTVFANNLWWLPINVNKGNLDYYLVRPVSPFFFLTLREFAANSFVNLLLALGVLV
jgi:ABC-2 type transport system permease protein